MSSTVLVGHTSTSSGPDNEPTTNQLSQSLRDLGITTFRLKTGTPARVYTDSIDFLKQRYSQARMILSVFHKKPPIFVHSKIRSYVT